MNEMLEMIETQFNNRLKNTSKYDFQDLISAAKSFYELSRQIDPMRFERIDKNVNAGLTFRWNRLFQSNGLD